MIMKKIFLMALGFFATINVMANDSIMVTIKSKVPSGESTMQLYHGGRNPLASISATNGDFVFNGKLPQDAFITLVYPTLRKALPVIADGANIVVDIETSKVTGTVLNDKLTDIMNNVVALSEKGDKKATIDYVIARVDENKSNILPAILLYQFGDELPFDKLKEYTNSDAAYTNHPLFSTIKRYVTEEEKSRAIIGTMFKDLTEKDLEGKDRKLSEFVGKGNYVLIDFWASWCGPCMKEVPYLKAAFDKYKSKGFNIVGLSFDNKEDAWKKAVKEKELNWTHLSDLKGWQSIAGSVYGIRSIPQSLLCDGEGRVVAVNLRGEALGKKLAEIYGF